MTRSRRPVALRWAGVGLALVAVLTVAFETSLGPVRPAVATPPGTPPSGDGEVSVRVGVSIGPRPGGTSTPTPRPSLTADPRPPGDPTTTPPGGGGSLPRTGMAVGGLLVAGGALVGGGLALRWSARRRASAERWLSRTDD
ncbi:hypothetical protein ACIBP4_07160 [Micromonospora maritima]|uniref:LPXTG-motif cell wall anchor domain-containing protein n=1 Tax=Micromonospora maritima TaxID=986711 RepID=A0ABW7ZJS0_9ACTN